MVVSAAGEAKPAVLLRDSRARVVVSRSPAGWSPALGVRDLIVVDTPDALLVCPRDRAQDVKKLVDDLKERASTDTWL